VRADKLTFGPQAQVTGRIVYKGPQAAEVQDGARVSTVEFTRVENHGKGGAGVAGLLTMWFLISLLAYFIAAWIVNHYYKAHVAAVANAIYSRPMKYLGIGIIALIVTPILSIIVLITFVGYYIAIIALALYVLLLVLSGLFSVIFTGSLIWKWFKKEPQMEFSWRTALVGAIVMALLKLIPFIGWAICAVIMLMAFGALISRLRPRTSPAPEVIV
jgi:hypothetical protein